MSCRPGKVGRLEHLRRPARVVCLIVAVGLLITSFLVPRDQGALLMTAGGAALGVAVLLLPVLTGFEVDLFGMKAKASLATREERLLAICRRESRRVTSFVRLVGVDEGQVNDLVEEAVEDAGRLWRGALDDELVGRLLMCRASHLIQRSLRLGGPYRVATPDTNGRDGSQWAAFSALEPRQRLIVAMAEWLDLDDRSIAEILDLDAAVIARAREDAFTPSLNGRST